ncbi:pheromone-regulated membrane protein Prm10 [Coprinopsis cinerea okayama7|uniref:Pheromone-regulated membrane protein Prm10 n=1 Tax=Coprinopsis cinerea (strain Okayama-7 / 130 / ATCC MYA-4618 / FGSC 9003) TaxID=240176 RepID=A8P211_COPC7|nr:pheromone-regulated membrane protein Prm10 [Coprinopsis cinerea okayama7\|eukprot:XP_001838217.2 pheromone-regulated membrane protein Prm10 [Coprinopsis cinerea okayama7\
MTGKGDSNSSNETRVSGEGQHSPKSGTRTPRRIRWLDERRRSNSAAHVLDPAGQDPESFNALVDALEKHRRETPKPSAATPLTSKVHYYSSRSPADGLGESFSDFDKDDFEEEEEGDEEDEDLDGLSSMTHLNRAPTLPAHYASSSPPSPMPDPGEAGPSNKESSKWYSRKKAKRMVQLHARRMWPRATSRKSRKGHHRREGSHPLDLPTPGPSHDTDIEQNRHRFRYGGDVDNEDEGDEEYGSGILSTLLQLYGHPESDDESRFSSAFSSGASTPWSEGWQSDSQVNLPDGAETPHRFDDKSRKRPRVPRPRLNLPSLGMVQRHPKARSGGGVFGALIATTGNLGGIAAPVHSQLQPDIHRSGYALSRYTPVDENPPGFPPALTTHSRSKSENAIELQRFKPPPDHEPPPKFQSLPPSPPSHHHVDQPQHHEVKPDRPKVKRMPSFKSIRSIGSVSGRSTPLSFLSTNSSVTHAGSTGPSEKFERREKRRKRKKAEIFITRHIAQIIQREEFLLKLTRAMMMFGSPTHRLPSQIQSAARVLDVHLGMLYLPDVALVSFDDPSTGTSHVRMIRQASSLDLNKLIDSFRLYWKVIHDKLSVSEASAKLDDLMKSPPMYSWWHIVLFGGMCSSAICTVSYGGSFIDALICFPLGALMMVIQFLSVRNQLYVHVFEITVTMLFSFIAAALAATHKFCYSAVASSSVVLILPGFIVLTGSLEIMSRNLVSGAVRLCYAIMYALFLGFGFAMGASLFEIMTDSKVYGTEDYECTATHDPNGPWYQRTPSKYWDKFPMFSTFLSLKNQAPWNRKETLVLILIACIGWTTNYFTGMKFKGQSDIIACIGAFAVGIVANIYARVFSGNAFVVMVTGILFQLPSGLGRGGLLSYATEQAAGSTESYISGFRTTLKLVSVAIGLAIGLGLAIVIAHPIQSRRREAGIFSL